MNTLKPITNILEQQCNDLVDNTIDQINKLTDALLQPNLPEIAYKVLREEREDLEDCLQVVISGSYIH